MKVIILAGGGGTRLFPLSRACYPKQFLRIGVERSLFGQTLERFLLLAAPSDIVVVTQEAYFFHVRAHVPYSETILREEASVLFSQPLNETHTVMRMLRSRAATNEGIAAEL